MLWQYSQERGQETRAIHIDLAEHVIKQKLLGRRSCANCKQSFNLADVLTDGYDMPAILPNPEKCSNGIACKPQLISRDDDTEEVISHRLDVYRQETAPLLKYFSGKGALRSFIVKKGISETNQLIDVMIK